MKVDLLEKAFAETWRHADLSKFRFDLKNGTQWKESTALPFSFAAEACPDSEVKARFAKDFERAFSLTEEAPLRLRLLQTKPNKAILGIVAHHVALDGWSIARLLEHATEAYNALVRGEALPALPWRPFEEYAQEYRRQLTLPASEKSRAFWEKQSFAAAPLLENYAPETRGHRVIYIFNRKYYQKIKELAKANQVTPFLFLLTCFSRSLSKILKREELLLSVPIASRDWDGAEFVLGNGVNLVPFDIKQNEEGSLKADIKAMRARYLAAIPHALTPIQTIEGMHGRDLSQVHFNFEPSVEEPKLDGLEIEFYPFPVTQVEKPIIINVNDTKKTYYVEIDYQFQALDLVRALTLFTETERVINRFAAEP